MKKDMLDDIKRHIEYTNVMEQKSIRDIQMQEMYFEIERLNNIINELEKWLEERLEKLDIIGDDDIYMALEIALNKLQELKKGEMK